MRPAKLAPILALAIALAVARCGGGPAPEKPAPKPAPEVASGVPADSLLAPVTTAEGKVTPPPPLPLEKEGFPAYSERTLDSGARLIVVRNDEQPVASIDLVFKAGSADDPAGEPGVADMVASLLDKGTTTRSGKEIAQGIDFVGGNLSANASADWLSVDLTVLTDFLDTGLDLLADVVMNPTFPQDELETMRARMLSALQLQLSQPNAVAQRRFLAEVYGHHPYGASETPASLKAITREDLTAYHDTYFTPDDALFVVAGAVDPDDVARRINETFMGWSGTAPAPPTRPAPPERQKRELVFVNKPGSVQAVIYVGQLEPSAAGSDRVSFDVMNQVLGGGYTSWLNNILRARKGWTYGARSGAPERLDDGYFQASTQTRNEVADSALATMLTLLDSIRSAPVPAADLDQARDYITGSFPLGFETPRQVAGQVAINTLLNRQPSYLEQYRSRVAATTAADVEQTAQQMLHPDRAVIVVVGDAQVLYDKLRAYADTSRLVDVEGNPMALADLEAPPVPKLDAGRVTAGTYTYDLKYRGQSMGSSQDAVAMDTLDGRAVVRVTSKVSPPIAVTQVTVFDAATFQPISLHMEGGRVQAMDMEVENGRVTGTAVDPRQGGTQPVDMAAPDHMLFSGMEGVAIATLDLAPGKKYTLPVVTTAGTVQPMNIEVTGEETVQVPAGSFDVYVLKYSGESNGTMYVRKQAPHILVRNALASPELVIELKEMR